MYGHVKKPETRKRKLTGIWNSEAVGRHGPHTVQHPCDKDRPLEDSIESCPIYLCLGRGSLYYASLVLLFLFFSFFPLFFFLFPVSGFLLRFTSLELAEVHPPVRRRVGRQVGHPNPCSLRICTATCMFCLWD